MLEIVEIDGRWFACVDGLALADDPTLLGLLDVLRHVWGVE